MIMISEKSDVQITTIICVKDRHVRHVLEVPYNNVVTLMLLNQSRGTAPRGDVYDMINYWGALRMLSAKGSAIIFYIF